MEVKVKYFGMIADAVGKQQEQLEVEANSTVDHFIEALSSYYPILQEHVYQISVNQKMSDEKNVLKEGDEIAILPPFSGG